MSLPDQLAILVIVVPLLGAPLCLLLNRGDRAWLLVALSGAFGLFASLGLLAQVQQQGAISYALGGWPAPLGIALQVDHLNALVLLIVSMIAAWTFAYARHSVEKEIDAARQPAFYAALLLVYAGLAGITLTGDAFNAFVFLEISSLSSYALISMGRDRRALTAAFQYLIMGTLGATFLLIGVGFLYMMTGTLNMADLAERLPTLAEQRTVQAGFAFITVGIALKVAILPLHLWLPNAYAYAPSVVSIFLAASATKVALYLLLRFVFFVFGKDFAFDRMGIQFLLLPLGVIAVLSMSLVAVFQDNLKRLLAYSSLAQIGYLLIGTSLDNVPGLTAALLHLFNHALIKGALFMALGVIAWRFGHTSLHKLAGVGRQMPWTMGAFVLGGLSLIGIPLTAGFTSKWLLAEAALANGWWWLLIVIAAASLLAATYIWRVIEVAYLRPPTESPTNPQDRPHEAPLSLLLPTWTLALANIYFGINTQLSHGTAQAAAQSIFGVTP